MTEYSKIVAVSGLPGLYELINSKADGAIVRSLEDGGTRFASSRVHNFSHLESIEIFTIRENVNLVEIFFAMEKAGSALPDPKDNTAVKTYFEKTYPDIDFARVYASDLKKMVKWFELLKNKNIEIKLSEPPAEEEPVAEIEEKKEAPEKKPAVKEKEKEKTTAKKPPAKKEESSAKATKPPAGKKESEEKKENAPSKKAAPKKATTAGKDAPKKKAAPKKK